MIVGKVSFAVGYKGSRKRLVNVIVWHICGVGGGEQYSKSCSSSLLRVVVLVSCRRHFDVLYLVGNVSSRVIYCEFGFKNGELSPLRERGGGKRRRMVGGIIRRKQNKKKEAKYYDFSTSAITRQYCESRSRVQVFRFSKWLSC